VSVLNECSSFGDLFSWRRKDRDLPVQIKLSDQTLVAEAMDFFWRVQCVAVAVSEDTIDVSLPGSFSERQERAEITTYLRTWQVAHPNVEIEILD
jgi:hypothetical protein